MWYLLVSPAVSSRCQEPVGEEYIVILPFAVVTVPLVSWPARRRACAIAERANPSTSAAWQTLQRFAPAGSPAGEDARVCASECSGVLTRDCPSPGERKRPRTLKSARSRICLPGISRQSNQEGWIVLLHKDRPLRRPQYCKRCVEPTKQRRIYHPKSIKAERAYDI